MTPTRFGLPRLAVNTPDAMTTVSLGITGTNASRSATVMITT